MLQYNLLEPILVFLFWSWSQIYQISQEYLWRQKKILVVPVVTICGLALLASNVKSHWWSLLPLTNFTKSSLLQNGNMSTQLLRQYRSFWRSHAMWMRQNFGGRQTLLAFASSSGLVHSADIYWALDWLIDFLLFLYLFCPISITFDNVESEDWLPPQQSLIVVTLINDH